MDDIAITRIMPNSLEAEQSVIGSMLMDKQAIISAGEILSADDFYHRQYGIMFQAMVDMNNAAKPVDIVTLQERMYRLRFTVLNLSGNCWQPCRHLPISGIMRRL